MLMNNLRNFPPVTLEIFQSTLLQEERLFTFVPVALSLIFQSTLLQEERPVLHSCLAIFENFNPRSYKRSDNQQIQNYGKVEIISIHAPTRGATTRNVMNSITALFQSTLLQEERRCNRHCDWCGRLISIHAPTRGATRTYVRILYVSNNFNPRSYKRSDHVLEEFAWIIVYFNPRSYKRSDNIHGVIDIVDDNFNPRSYKRSDNRERKRLLEIFISIHAPTRGATLTDPIALATAIYFNPRSYKRSDCLLLDCFCIQSDFNPRSYKRSDFHLCCEFSISGISIHAPTRGATAWRHGRDHRIRISIHAPTRGATAKMHNNPYTYL